MSKECEQYEKAYATVDKNEELLLELLDGKEKSLFIEYINANGEVNGATAYESFAEGVKLGTRMMREMV